MTSPNNPHPNRRRHPRLTLQHPVKIVCCDTGRCLPAQTTDLSPGGALLQVHHPCLLVPGQKIKVGIAFQPQQMLLTHNDLYDATILRSLGHHDQQTIAVEFTQSLPALAASA